MARYERAHFFDNVDYEISRAHTCFVNIGEKIAGVFGGEHYEVMTLTAISMTTTVGFVLLLPTARQAHIINQMA